MKETIEWFKTTDNVRPSKYASIIMKFDDVSGGGVIAGVFSGWGEFLLINGEVAESVTPIMWCYFPKGTQ
jgi:hypothetical protein